LAIRIKLHSKHSTNKQGFASWLFDKYSFKNDNHILELGCGNGGQWENRIDSIPNGCTLILSDFSSGMVDIVREKYSKQNNVSFKQIDIQSIPLPDETIDIVIANHMLYHVPDLSKALSEVKRVLKTGGKFYSATNGNGGMQTFLHEAFKDFDPETKAFTEQFPFSLQNGTEILGEHFSNIQRIDFEDSLSVTETQALVDWVKTASSVTNYSEKDFNKLFDYFENIRITDGAINIPKEVGLFVSTK
jgi:ubiquinone/menaquinone biosynthesis C-methylase UbiE